MRVAGNGKKLFILNTKGFYLSPAYRGAEIVDIETHFVMGRYASPERAREVFKEMMFRYTGGHENYVMPEE